MPVAEEATTPLRVRVERVPHLPTAVGKAPPADPRRDPDPDGETWTSTTTWDSAQTPTHPAAEDPSMMDRLDPQAEDPPEDRREEDDLVDPRAEGRQAEDPLEDHQAETPPTNRRERTSGDGSCTSRGRSGAWSKSAAVAAKAQKELDIAKFEAGKLSGVVTKLQRRLDRLEDPRSDGSDRPLPLESGSDDSWGPGPDPGRSRGRTKAPRSDYAPSTRGITRRSNPMPPRRSGEEERDEWLSADYGRRRDPLRTPVQPKRPRHAPKPAPPAYGRYGALRDGVPEEDMEWDLQGPDGDPIEDFA